MFGYKSTEAVEACVRFYAEHPQAPTIVGNHAVLALNSLLGAVNRKRGGRTYSTVFAQPGHDGGTVRLLYADSKAETPAEHATHEWMLKSREAFGHQKTRPVEDFEPVDEQGRNFYFLRTTFAPDNRTAVETPRMHVGEFFDEAAARFWLVDLPRLDKSARPKARVHSLLAALNEKKPNDCECENSSRSSWTIALVLMLIVASALLIWNVAHLNAFRREKRAVFPPSYQSIN
ncbi:hypothetical protein M3Y99_01118100 [Aphelenchoides fujianensis]|nr:hypothetical protein M3Y99_01118100 [Aphelenchoides fujianensis]